MAELHASIRGIPMPARIKRLPLTDAGFPILFFADINPETGKSDLRIMDGRKLSRCIKERRCWLCGDLLGKHLSFVLGPMCCVTRTTAEPPSHLECARYAVRACPFLTRPHMHRNESRLPEGVTMAGYGIRRNPGATAIWNTRSFKVWRPDSGGILMTVGEPESVEWYAEGRRATYTEVAESIESGAPLLFEQALADRDPDSALRELHTQIGHATKLLKGLPGREARKPEQQGLDEVALIAVRGEEIAWFLTHPDETQYIRPLRSGEVPAEVRATHAFVKKLSDDANLRSRAFGSVIGGRFIEWKGAPT